MFQFSFEIYVLEVGLSVGFEQEFNNSKQKVTHYFYDKYTRNKTLSIWLGPQFTQCYGHVEKDLFYFILDLDFYVIFFTNSALLAELVRESTWPSVCLFVCPLFIQFF